MKSFKGILLSFLLAFVPLQVFAAIPVSQYGTVYITSPNTIDDYYDNFCSEGNIVNVSGAAQITTNCIGRTSTPLLIPTSSVTGLSTTLSTYLLTATATSTYEPKITPSTISDYYRGDKTFQALNKAAVGLGSVDNTSDAAKPVSTATQTALNAKFTTPAGSTSQYVRGDGSLATLPSAGSRTFNYPSRTLASCFQVSSTNDADVNYSVDVTATLTLGGGTGVLTSYTNSGCTTGAQSLANGAVSSVALLGTSSIPLHGIAKAGTWLKVTGTGTGGGTAAIDGVQAETILP